MHNVKLFAKCGLVEYIISDFDNWWMRKNAKLPRVLGSRVRRARKEAGLTQEDLAYKIGVSRVYMGFIEQGRNVPSLEILEKIARVLRTRLADFVR